MDEAHIENREDYPYGYNPIGERVYASKSGRRSERVSWVAALKGLRLFELLTFTGSCNRELLECWRENSVLSQINRGDVLVMDNVSFHQARSILELIERVGCEIWYLLPCSPGLNNIEHHWAGLKNWIQQHQDEFELLQDAVDAVLNHCPKIFP